MTKLEKIILFFQSLRNNSPQNIRDAAAAVGDYSDVAEVITGYIEGKEIKGAAALIAELSGAQEQARQKAAQEQAATALAAMATEFAAESAPEKRRDLIKGIRSAAVSLEPSASNGFQFVRMDSLQARPPSWLVKGLIETDCFGCLYGDPAAGKSFIAIELSSCVSTGSPFYGLPVKKGPVIFLAGEGQSGLARRFKAWSIARHVSLNGAPLYINRGSVSLIDSDSMIPVIQALERLLLEIGRPPALVILDTWSRVLGGDDSAPSDAAAGVAALDELRARFGNFAALVVHHEGHTKGRGRGWSGLRAAVDVELRAERGSDRVVRLECTKAKDIEPIEPMAFHFSPVELGFNDDEGNPVASAVLTPAAWTPAPDMAKKPPIGKNQAMALDVLKRLEKEAGKTPVQLERWREACIAAGLERNQFWYAKTGMEKSGYIQISGESVCCTGVGLGVGIRGLLYNPPNPPNAPTPITPVGNTTPSNASNTSNASNAPDLFQAQ
jgi:hypothetical protein